MSGLIGLSKARGNLRVSSSAALSVLSQPEGEWTRHILQRDSYIHCESIIIIICALCGLSGLKTKKKLHAYQGEHANVCE